MKGIIELQRSQCPARYSVLAQIHAFGTRRANPRHSKPMATSPKPAAAAKSSDAAPATPSTPSSTNTVRRARSENDSGREWRQVVTKLNEAEARVQKMISKSGVALAADTARSIVSDAVSKSLSAGLSEKDVWDAVIAREQQRLENLSKLRDAAR